LAGGDRRHAIDDTSADFADAQMDRDEKSV
jgi:hypothetical protein